MTTTYPVPQERILRALGRFRYLSAQQLSNLLYPNGVSNVRKHCAELLAKELLTFTEIPRTGVGGRSPQIYYLTATSIRYLKKQGVPVTYRRQAPAISNLPHTLDINNVIVLCLRLEGFQAPFYLLEHESKARPVGGIAPDALVLMQDREGPMQIAFEIDRDNEDRVVFMDKIKALAYYSQGSYREHFPYETLMICYVLTVDNPKRLQTMLRWAKRALDDIQAQSLYDTFHFTMIDNPEGVIPEQFFNQPIWYTLGGGSRVSLIETTT